MPKRTDIKSILIIGAGPIIIGQACEFDYSGTQACKALKDEGYRIILVNSNPATIMTDPDLADATYIEPITPEIVAKIIEKERPRRAAADHGRPDRAQLRALAPEDGRAREVRRRDDRRHRRGHRQGRGPRALPRGDDEDRPRHAALASRQNARRGARGARRDRPALHHPPVLHPRRHRRRHRLQQGRVPRHRRARHRRLADQRGADRGERARLEGVRDGGRPRQEGQLHHHLLDREHRPDGRPHRRFDHRRPGADADRQGIPDHARRLARGAARDRRRDRRLATCSSPSIPPTAAWSSSR